MSTAIHNFNHKVGSEFDRKIRLMARTGIPVSIYNSAVHMQIRPSPESETLLLELSTENGGVKHYGSDLFLPGGALYKAFLDKVWTETSPGVWKLAFPYWIYMPGTSQKAATPDGVMALWISAIQSAEKFQDYARVYYDLEVTPLLTQADWVTYMDNQDYVILANDGPDGAGTLTTPFRAFNFHTIHEGGMIQLINPSNDASTFDSEFVPYANTIPRKITISQQHKLWFSHPWETTGTYACAILYLDPPLRASTHYNKPIGVERLDGDGAFNSTPAAGSDLLSGAGAFSDATLWTSSFLEWEVNEDASGVATLPASESDTLIRTVEGLTESNEGYYTCTFTTSGISGDGKIRVWILDGGEEVAWITTNATHRVVLKHGKTNSPWLIIQAVGPVTIANMTLTATTGWTITGWSYDATNDTVSHSAGTTAMKTTNPVLTADDVGKNFHIKMMIANPAGPDADDIWTPCTVGDVTIACGGRSWEVGVGKAYPFSSMSYTFTFDVESVTGDDAYIEITPSNDFAGHVDGILLRQAPDYGSLTIDNDNGSGRCRITASKGGFRMDLWIKGVRSHLFNKDDMICISNSENVSDTYSWDGIYTIQSVTDTVMEITPIPELGGDASGLRDLILMRLDGTRTRAWSEGYFDLRPNTTR